MANEKEASPPSISLGSTGSDSHNESAGKMRPVKFREAAAFKIGHQDELLKYASGELSFDAELPTPGDYLGECPDCCYMLRSGSLSRPGSQQHTEYCLNQFVCPGNETSSADTRQEHLSELQGKHCQGRFHHKLLIRSRNAVSDYRYSLGYSKRSISIHHRCRYCRRESWHG